MRERTTDTAHFGEHTIFDEDDGVMWDLRSKISHGQYNRVSSIIWANRLKDAEANTEIFFAKWSRRSKKIPRNGSLRENQRQPIKMNIGHLVIFKYGNLTPLLAD